MKPLSENNYVKYALYCALLLLAGFNFITPLWGNVLLGFGALLQSSYRLDFPADIVAADYIRGPVYKLLLYVIMNVSAVFVEMKNYFAFQLVAKIIYYASAFCFTFGALKLAFREHSYKELLPAQSLLWLILMLSGYRQFMESEELAVIFVIGHFLFIYSENKKANYLSGIFIFLLFGCKAVTLGYLGFALLYWLLYIKDKEKSKRIITSHIAFGLVTILLYATVFRAEIDNITAAMSLQNSAKFDGLPTIKRFAMSLFRYLYYLPGLIIIPAALLFTLIKNRKQFLFITLAVLLASSCVIVQNRFSSPYHYLAFIPVILYIVFFSFDQPKYILTLLLLPVFAVIVIQNLSDSTFYPKASNKMYRRYFHLQAEGYTAISEYIAHDPDPDGKILYLSGDCPVYFIHIPNNNDRVGVLLLNRGTGNERLQQTRAYQDLYQNIKDYNGKYILYDPEYLPAENFPDIENKLKTFYTPAVSMHNEITLLGEGSIILYRHK
jgi:hypothetical protein